MTKRDELVERKAEPVQPEYGYMRIVEVFDRNETAGAFLSEDGEGGFAAGVSRMADEIDRLRAALSAAPEPVTVEGGGNAVPQTLDEIIENSLRMWYFNYDPSLDHTAARIAMREIIRYVIDVARVSPTSPSPVDSRDALDELEKARAEQWRLRREAEGSRDAARAAADSLRIERDTLRGAIEPFAKLYAEIPEDNFWPSEEYRNLKVAAEAYALSTSPPPVDSRDDRDFEWKLVPIKPTLEMAEKGAEAFSLPHPQSVGAENERAAIIYRLMLDASPEGRSSAAVTDRLPAGHVILEQADTLDGRVSQTVRRPNGTEYERIVDGDEAYGSEE